jgi:uncharacterized protein (DUF608 family)
MVCLEGTGALSHVSLRHEPRVYFEPPSVFAAVSVAGRPELARVVEGPVPQWKKFGRPDSGNGSAGATYGLPRFRRASFRARFPFAEVEMSEEGHPLGARILGWSPFTPPDADPSSLPIAALEYEFSNSGTEVLDAVFSFHARNFMETRSGEVLRTDGGFILGQQPVPDALSDEGYFLAVVDGEDPTVNAAWFRGSWFDALSMIWRQIVEARIVDAAPPVGDGASPGGSIFVPISLAPGERRTVRLLFAWYVPRSALTSGSGVNDCSPDSECDCNPPTYRPWYAAQFAGVEGVAQHWRSRYVELKERTAAFTDALYETTAPDAMLEAVAANLTILKSPTILRQADGRLWMWEGCRDSSGCCPGSCTHVWNYAQAIAHLFPSLERGLRETEYKEALELESGHQAFRVPLPIRESTHRGIAASDGQLGSIMRVYREWRISGDTDWLRSMWPAVQRSLDFCIRSWDPDGRGVLEEPHHNTYDIEFWGAEPMCSGFYLGALRAVELMGRALGEQTDEYEELYSKGRAQLETDLFNGEYFYQKTQWTGLRSRLSVAGSGALRGRTVSEEERELAELEGPKYQYGAGCLSDQVLGDWLSRACGIGGLLDEEKVGAALEAIVAYNLRDDLWLHANSQRPTFAFGEDGGLLNCTWPHGGRPSLPFVYSDEVWTGIEYHVASHLLLTGHPTESRRVVELARKRYDGRTRNPFDEYECGHWYGRALSSYGLLQAIGGVFYDAVRRALRLSSKEDFTTFLSTATGFGVVGVRDGDPFVDVRWGQIPVDEFLWE